MRSERLLIGAAAATAAYMLFPVTSPLFATGKPEPAAHVRASVSGKTRVEETATPTPAPPPRKRPPPIVAKGINMSGYSAGGSSFDRLVSLVGRTELNTIVLDVKDETGHISWIPRSPAAARMGAGLQKMKDPQDKIKQMKAKGIYVIGRVVVFKDPILSRVRPDLAVQDTEGGVWKDRKGLGWGDPFSPEVWAYAIDVAKEAVAAGVDEIQFDYVRFPSDGDLSRMWFPHRDGRPETEVIQTFLATARAQLVPLGVYMSADVFGLVTLAQDDLGIGQKIELIAQEVDYLSLMLYPSHYHKPEYGLKDPEREPYRTIELSLADAKRRTAGTRAKLRPWLQDFSLAVRYTPADVRAQIKAAEDAGTDGWLLWNARNLYSEDALRPKPSGSSPRPSATPVPSAR